MPPSGGNSGAGGAWLPTGLQVDDDPTFRRFPADAAGGGGAAGRFRGRADLSAAPLQQRPAARLPDRPQQPRSGGAAAAAPGAAATQPRPALSGRARSRGAAAFFCAIRRAGPRPSARRAAAATRRHCRTQCDASAGRGRGDARRHAPAGAAVIDRGAAAGGSARARPAAGAPGQSSKATGRLQNQGAGRHHHHRYAAHLSLSDHRPRQGDPLRHRCRPRRLHLVGHRAHFQDEGMAGLVPAGGDDRAPALSAAHDGGGSRQSARRARALSRPHALPHPRHQPALDHRQDRIVRLHPAAQQGYRGSLQPRAGRQPRGGVARPVAAIG